MSRQWFSALGYLSIFLMPALLLIGAIEDSPWLAFGVVALVFPLARVAFGALPAAGAPEWNETVATFLDRLPLAYAATLPICLLAGLTFAGAPLSGNAVALLGFALSLWMTLLFGTCVAHDLIHRRDKNQAMLGHVLAGMCPDGHFKFPHLWPLKLPQAGRSDYGFPRSR